MAKIIFDKIVSTILLIICIPLLLIIAFMVRCSSPGPIIFSQKRVGYNGTQFTIYKFRGMLHGSGKPFDRVLAGDPRVTRVGQIIRSTHLDELPQPWNIIKGDMSMIGPRPQPIEYSEREMICNPQYTKLLSVRPGLSGPVQIKGRSWAIANKEASFLLNIEYIKQRSVFMDLCLLLCTVPVVFKRHGL